jgi:hypothetical protein
LSFDPAATQAAKAVSAAESDDGPLVGMVPLSQLKSGLELVPVRPPCCPVPIHEKQALGLLHSVCLWQLPSQLPAVPTAR